MGTTQVSDVDGNSHDTRGAVGDTPFPSSPAMNGAPGATGRVHSNAGQGDNKASVRRFTISDSGKDVRNKIDQGALIFKSVEDFCTAFVDVPEKRRPIKKILVATNGIAAVRCILSIRRLLVQLFRDDKLIKFICLTTEQEIRSNAEYLKLADFTVLSPGGDNRNNYANVDEIVSHAVEKEVDAVWAGWGHASENPELPRQLAARNIVFIGPPASAMFSLGDKIASTIIAQTVGIPTIEWSGSGIQLEEECQQGKVEVSQHLFDKACVSTIQEGLKAMEQHRIGYPMMIKASEGGGGKGIRKCKNEADFRENFVQVQTEVPGSPIFLMKCVENARHIEVQLIADRYGTVIPIFTRDCSIQRRCQKIIEEAPASIAPESTLKKMQQDAVNIAQLVGYESAGTVEYMYLPSEDKYFFLELNPRLQVEHPCTEMLANINIPAIQLQIAMGLPLNRIADVRLFYDLDRNGNSPLPKELVRTNTEYAVIAARITSEDPEDFFRPSTGSVEVLNFRSAQNVWGYFSVSGAGKVHEYADSQFGHLFARGRTRHEAVSVLLCALQELELRATFASQVSYLVDLLKEPDFTENKFNTQWLDNRIANKVLQKSALPLPEIVAISSAVIGHRRVETAFTNFKLSVERGQVLPTKDLTETFVFDLVKDMNIYKVMVTRTGPLNFRIDLNGGKTEVEIRTCGDGSLLVNHKERTYQCHLEETSDKFKVTIGRSLVVFEKDNDPTILKSPYTGKLLSYKKANRELVSVGVVFAQVESMKLVFNVEVKKAPGRLEHVAKEGDLLYPGSVIARLVDQKDSEKYRPKPFTEKFIEWESDDSMQKNLPEPNKLFNQTYEKCVNLLNGSIPPGMIGRMDEIAEELFSFLESSTLPQSMCKAAMNSVHNRIPEPYMTELRQYAESESSTKFEKMLDVLQRYFQRLQPNEWETARALCDILTSTCEKLEGGSFTHTCHVLNQLLLEYKNTEQYFEGRTYDDAVALLNEKHETDKDKVVAMIYSHTQIKGKNQFMVALLKAVERRGMHLVAPLAENLREIGNMFHTEEVSEKCRCLLLQNSHVKYRKFANKVLWDAEGYSIDERSELPVHPVGTAMGKLHDMFREKATNGFTVEDVLATSPWIHKVLHEFFFDDSVGDLAIRAYIALHFLISEVSCSTLKNGTTVYDFCIDKTTFSTGAGTSHRVCIVLLPAHSSGDASLTESSLLSEIADKYTGTRTNGCRPTLRVTFLKQVLCSDLAMEDHASVARQVLLEELPMNSESDDELISTADEMGNQCRETLKKHLPAFEVTAHILVCKQNRPLMQIDMLSAEKLELWRLPADSVVVSDRLSSLYAVKYDDPDGRFSRLFVRELVEIPIRHSEGFEEEVIAHIRSALDAACGVINVNMRRFKKNVYVSNHVYLYVTFPKMPKEFTQDNQDTLDYLFEETIREQMSILSKHFVTEGEIVAPKFESCQGGIKVVNRRLKFLDETGVTPEFGVYDEDQTVLTPCKHSHQLYGSTIAPYSKIRKIEKKRATTRNIGTTYVYDFPILFGRSVMEMWRSLEEAEQTSRNSVFETQFKQLSIAQRQAYYNGDYRPFVEETELVVKDNHLIEVNSKEELRQRADNCNNETGVVAWNLKLFTPEKPNGYMAVVIANDITFQSGSFATPEDLVYSLASEYSRKRKLPRVNVSSNSGARIGLAEDVCKKFRAKFIDSEHPEEGFQYLYVDGSEQERLGDQLVYDKMPNGLLRIRAVIGREDENIGVENLQGSGLIAGETSAAYDEVPTYCFVTGRSVGIGAYTARLAHRIVQARSSHLILTGAPALNTLLGKEVYTSNNQLGGTQIMFKNGVTHAVVEDDFEGIRKIVQWMSYLPSPSTTFPFQERFGQDSGMRAVTYNVEPNKSYDVRDLIDSKGDEECKGICDCNSFDEIMNDWAKTIVAGRARLGGIPVGVVSSELRNVKSITPADPACPNSQAVEVHQAGQVWYPDSAFKTAEVIGDFNREGLPLLFIASLRGFSGGQQDMFQMVLKFGAQIVDALRQYKMPVIVYIPSCGELRGGAWAVLDSKINPGFIQMVADRESRGGILEPPAIVSIKFRGDKMSALQKRNDEIIMRLSAEMAEEINKHGAQSQEAAKKKRLLDNRAESLHKAYRSVANEFADLHDRAERMLKKGAVQHVTDMKDCRNLFISMLQSELVKVKLCERYLSVTDRTVTRQDAYKWVSGVLEEFSEGCTQTSPADQVKLLQKYLETSDFETHLKKVKATSVERDLLSMNEDELRQMKLLLEKCASQRKFSL